jgi:hypothetical protein
VNTLILKLLGLVKSLEPAPSASSGAVGDFLRATAASVIQQDPTQADIPPGDVDPLVVEAIHAGAEQVAVLNKTSATLRLSSESLPLGTLAARAGEQVAETFGPFIDAAGGLVRVVSFQSAPLIAVVFSDPLLPRDFVLFLLIPPGSTPDTPDLRTWTLAPGTVWIRSSFLVAGATGFTGLRVSSGTLKVAAGTTFKESSIALPFQSAWSLSVEPELAPPAGAGSDAGALALTLPTRLDVGSNAAPTVSGAPLLSGFGSDLHFTLSGSPFFDGSQICFPMHSAESNWSIAGNASTLAAFTGDSPIASANFALPVSSTSLADIGEATHGGSLVVRLNGGLTSTFAAQQGGPSNWFVSDLTANAQRVELEGLQADSAARYDFDFWNTSSSSLRFNQRPISRLLFRSERGAIDTAAIFGGAISDKWDLPGAANGQPFPFEGAIDSFGLLSNPSGSWVTISATAPPPAPDPLLGLVLENLYLVVKAPRKLFVISPFDTPPLLSAGIAILLFDVNLAVPTLPDPYATNLPLAAPQGGAVPLGPAIVASGFGIHLAWADTATPTIRAYLNLQVQFLEPPSNVPSDVDAKALWDAFHTHISSQPELLYLLDMSSREHLLGVAIESPAHSSANLIDNRLAVPMRSVRLLMQPQVQWEPVQIEPNPQLPPLIPPLVSEIAHSKSNGGPTLVGANTVTLVPTLPEPVTAGILDAISLNQPSAALFTLPFGLQAMTLLSPPDPSPAFLHRPVAITELHEPAFDTLTAARQFRITARNNPAPIAPDAFFSLPGMMRQLANLQPNGSNLTSVTPPELTGTLNSQFASFVPLQHADLSGYGLSTFSQWGVTQDGVGFNKAEFQVLNGRTAYEVLQFRSILYECGARVVRTVILERHPSGRVFRTDSGWVALEPGLFTQPISFEKGAVRSFQNIRRIRINGEVRPLIGGTAVQPVLFDADADILDHPGSPVPIYDRPGYIQVQFAPPPPVPPAVAAPLTDTQLKALFDKVGPIGSPVDCVIRLAKTLEMQLSSIVSDVALDDTGKQIGFAVAVVGSPKLPRAGQWNVMRIDPATREVSPVDPRRGVPVVRVGLGVYRFREPSDARLTNPRIQHGLLLSTESSRVLFPQPFVSLAPPGGKLEFDLPPVMADPYSLVQSTGHFPRPGFGLGLKEKALFHIADDNHWRIDAPEFNIDTIPAPGLMQGGDWGITRGYQIVPTPPPPPPALPVIPPTTVNLNIDSAAAVALNIAVPRSNLNLDLPAPLDSILKIHTNYEAVAGGLPKLAAPTLEFSGALQELTDILNSLSQLLNLPFAFDVSITSSGGASPSFVVHMHLNFRLGKSPEDRVEVGMGKFYGEFTVNGELEAALTGINRALLFVEFKGDMQQGILPPLLYAGGLFRFSIELHDTGSPTIQLGLGVVFSIGGDLIPGLIAVEATVHYGYTLIPETLDPGALIGIDARASLLGGLIGFSFGVEAMARIRRKPEDRGIVTIWAQILVAATVHFAIFLDEEVHLQTQFQQDIPMAALSLIPGVGILPAAASLL